MANEDSICFKALYAPFSHKKRKNWSDGFVSLLLPKNAGRSDRGPATPTAVLKDSDQNEIVRSKLTSSWHPQV